MSISSSTSPSSNLGASKSGARKGSAAPNALAVRPALVALKAPSLKNNGLDLLRGFKNLPIPVSAVKNFGIFLNWNPLLPAAVNGFPPPPA